MNSNSYIPIIGLAILNGLFSPFLAYVFALHPVWYPFFLPSALPIVFALSSLIISTLTLMIAGVPAALTERVLGNGQTNFASGLVWLIGVAILTFPAVGNIMAALGLNPQ